MSERETTQPQRDTISKLHSRGYTLQGKRWQGDHLALALKHYLTDEELTYTVDAQGNKVTPHRDHNHERGAAYTYTFGYLDEDYRLQVMVTSPRPFAECGICGCTPVGYGCYHICPNSVHYYTAEQERYDDQFYGMDDERERYAATIEPSQYYEPEDEIGTQALTDEVAAELFRTIPSAPFDTDDIPF